jgi:hypothetical protein
MDEPKIAIIGNGGQGRTLSQTILSKAIRNTEEMKLLQAYLDTGLLPEEVSNLAVKWQGKELNQHIQELLDAEKQGLLIKMSKDCTAKEAKEIFHTLMQRCYGVPIPRETTDYAVDDLMR